ncbi:hypothetical protein QM806_38630 [Rhodococcus sp. IEGM 1351]|uniref:hypothetical protein n=1 Tax=Rhodococcus sp. IEGM 1351 TaxID=3047089 RepID=UPI0024B7A636|nr:hypothetical protein [Rhodococcus sp. IEGM 1351]MDI9941268.1 hypothetical protein [Rhodococcus sp. IEGM 1351]
MAGGGTYAGVVVAPAGVVLGAVGARSTDDVADAAAEVETDVVTRAVLVAAVVLVATTLAGAGFACSLLLVNAPTAITPTTAAPATQGHFLRFDPLPAGPGSTAV